MKDDNKKKTTDQILLDEDATREAMNCEEEVWRDPDVISIYNATIENEDFSITVYRPMEYNLAFRTNWKHILVRPVPSVEHTPSHVVMSKIASTFPEESRNFMQVIPKRSNYVSREEYTLHLWTMQSACNFQIDEVNDSLLSEADGDCVRVSKDSLGNEYLAVISEKYWPSWGEVVALKEQYFGTNVDAIIVNRGFDKDVAVFGEHDRKIVLVWKATDIDLPDSFLV